MRILITGSSGTLGTVLATKFKADGFEIYAMTRTTMDVTDERQVRAVFLQLKPDIVFHLAAETDVDRCEKQKNHAYLTNVIGTRNICDACCETGATLVFMSSAAIFDGTKLTPYREEDPPNPVNYYGETKLKGENIILSKLDRHFIIRTGWLIDGSRRDKKFVGQILRLMESKKELFVVSDTRGSPLFTFDFAATILELIRTKLYGVYHYVNAGTCSRMDLAKEIIELLDLREVSLNPISIAAYPAAAARPRREVLDDHRLRSLNLFQLPDWRVSLRRALKDSVCKS